MRRILQFSIVLSALTASGAMVMVYGPSLAGPIQHDLTHAAIFETAWIATAAWFAALICRVGPTPAWLFRGVYAWGCAAFVLHVAVSFHLGHGWSHAAAVKHVEHRSGFGPGILVSHLFMVVWIADAAWSAVAFESYRGRAKWWNVAVYGFMAFIVLNATVVYGAGPARWLGAAGFLTLLAYAQKRHTNFAACSWNICR